jgi:hypothetical protein
MCYGIDASLNEEFNVHAHCVWGVAKARLMK